MDEVTIVFTLPKKMMERVVNDTSDVYLEALLLKIREKVKKYVKEARDGQN